MLLIAATSRSFKNPFVFCLQTYISNGINATNKGSCSRYEFAKDIVSLAGLDVTIQKVPHEQSDFSAARPVNAVLNNFILSLTDIYDFPEWKDSLKKYLKEIGEIA